MERGKNYQPWQLNINEFPSDAPLQEQLKFLLRFAILAPSSHNSQPWKFNVSGNVIEVSIAEKRKLPKSDANHRQLIISLGCAIKNITLAADYFSLPVSISYFPQGEQSDLVAIITAGQRSNAHQPDSNHLANLILERRTNRNKYDPSRLPDQRFLQELKNSLDSGIRVDIIHDKNQREKIADAVVHAGIEAMDSDDFRYELSQYLISNVSKSGTGMPGFSIGMPTPPSLIIPKLIRYFNFSKLSKKQDEKLLKEHTPTFCIISTKEDTAAMWLRVGEYFEEKALLAEKFGLAMAPLAAAIQIADNYKKLQEVLRTDYRPQFFCRLGYPVKKALHSPRLSVEEVSS